MGKKKIKLDEFHYHEALDRSYIIADMIENVLITHPVIENNKDLKIKVEKAQDIICEVYQMIGGLVVKEFPKQSEIIKNE